ncbi:methyltransferase-like protein 27 isoform X2 [Anneissia japonica]|uniref:methyltransferase-like protein 27 isoform X2 n=1 Tax=Anneissia japonica TaxID=1529436 RepID=UPI001425581B|nr:methyltransferase-like protein 27 isoform X2 [Anneissia japonica]
MSEGQAVRERYTFFIDAMSKAGNAEGAKAVYDKWAETYDQDVMAPENQHYGRAFLVEALQKMVTDKSVKILDFAAGTGIVGQMVKQAGFNNIDALDCSNKCLEKAKEKHVYQNLMEETAGQRQLAINDNTYDVLICSAGFGPNLLNQSVFSEWIRITKPGGYIFNSFRKQWLKLDPSLNDGKFEKEMQRLEDNYKWKLVGKEVQNGIDSKEALLFVHRIC